MPPSPAGRQGANRGVVLATALAALVAACTANASPSTSPAPNGVEPAVDAGISGRLAFQGPGRLEISNLDGSGRVPLLPDDRNGHHPDWSPDGKHLVYVTDEADGTSDIHVVDRDGSNDRLLVDCVAPCTYAEDPAWSPDGTRIAYWDGDETHQFIRVADATTGTVLVTVAGAALVGPVGPRWSPDGRRLVIGVDLFKDGATGPVRVDSRIGRIDLGAPTPGIVFLTPPGMAATYPDWSPDGSRIVFDAGNLDPFPKEFALDLYTVAPDGTGLTRIVTGEDHGVRLATPTWTRADPPILVTVIDGADWVLGALQPDGSGLVRLTDEQGLPIRAAHPRAWVSRP